MKEEIRTDNTDVIANACKKIAELDKENRLLGERCNQLLKDKGDLTDELAKWKDEWQEQVQKAIDEGWERTKLTGIVRELENKIADIKADYDFALGEKDVEIMELKKQIPVWHDLRKDPNDLPKDSMRVLVLLEDKLCEISSISADNRWLCTDYYTGEDKVIAWCEIPQFKE